MRRGYHQDIVGVALAGLRFRWTPGSPGVRMHIHGPSFQIDDSFVCNPSSVNHTPLLKERYDAAMA